VGGLLDSILLSASVSTRSIVLSDAQNDRLGALTVFAGILFSRGARPFDLGFRAATATATHQNASGFLQTVCAVISN
jgi:hypothetical protein